MHARKIPRDARHNFCVSPYLPTLVVEWLRAVKGIAEPLKNEKNSIMDPIFKQWKYVNYRWNFGAWKKLESWGSPLI